MGDPEKIPISVCILVKNEEENLLRSLPPLSIFNEILVYDSGSTDKSIEICEKYGAKVISGEWLGFPRSREKLFSLASQPWIFWLDADEVVTSELGCEIKSLFNSPPEVDGFEINRIVFFLDKWIKHGEWFPDWNLRIFKSSEWKIVDQDVHESVRISGKVLQLNSLLEHYSYKNWDDRKARIDRYSELWARMKSADGRKVIYGEEYIRAGWRFFRAFFLKYGFLDSITGFKIAISIDSEVILKYKKLRLFSSK
jgi:glycosyltransferase involved in cell wall biosynthesis